MDRMLRVVVVTLAIILTIHYSSGKYCNKPSLYYVSVRKCWVNIWGWCVGTSYRSAARYRNRRYCCPGYTGSTCSKPVCSPGCQNGGRCVSPNTCSCPLGTSGTYCQRVNGKWLSWSSWRTGTCSVSCGSGSATKSRSRTCIGPRNGGRPCMGESKQSLVELCTRSPCPVNGYWLSWSSWTMGACSVTCGNGSAQTSRSRTCIQPRYGGNRCVGSPIQSHTISCSTFTPCPVDGEWREWTSWKSGICSVTCGNGTMWKARSRDCEPPKYGGKDCQGSDVENVTEECIMRRCPVCETGLWLSWTSWGTCSVTCGSGVKHRERSREITGDPECTRTDKQSGLGYCEEKKCLIMPALSERNSWILRHLLQLYRRMRKIGLSCHGDERVRHPIYCSEYFVCNGTAFVRKACPGDKDFNEKLGQCTSDPQEECNFTMPGSPAFGDSKNLFDVLNKEFLRKFKFHESDMPKKEDRMLEMIMRMFPEMFMAGYCEGNSTRVHPLDCSRYMQCNQGQLFEKKCHSDQRWNPSEEACLPKEKVECHEFSKDHPCGELFGLYSDKDDCTNYHMCIYGRTHTYTCEEGNVFEARTGYCRKRLDSDKC